MKVLLVGFSQQNAAALSLLLEREFATQAQAVERAFDVHLNLCLPDIVPGDDIDAMVINLDGTGVIYSPARVQSLREFIGVRAAVFVTKHELLQWHNADILPKGLAIFVHCPYGKQTITGAFDKLIKAAPTAKLRQSEFDITHLQEIKQSEHFLHALVQKNFGEQALLHNLLDIYLEDGALAIQVGDQTIYIDKSHNLALVPDKDKLLHYCSVAKDLGEKRCLHAETVEPALLANVRAPKYALSLLLWQMYDAILPENLHANASAKDLRLKMRYMPNFNQNTPYQVSAIASSALALPRSLGEIATLVPSASDALIARVFMLAVLSGAQDIDVLRPESTQASAKESTQAVQSAKRSGFFGRLLQKLSLRSA